jgi:Peptidase M50B-like
LSFQDPVVKRLHQAVLIASTLVASWLGMQDVHELGHVLGAWLSGGRVARVVLHPLTISRTDLADNPSPLVVVWAGPVLGVLLPVAAWVLVALLRPASAYLLRFFTGFCLIANGAYLAGGSVEGIGDCGEMLRHGSPVWLLWLFGGLTVPAGLWLWHRQGPHFGLGPARGRVSVRAAYASLAAALLLLALGFVVDGE